MKNKISLTALSLLCFSLLSFLQCSSDNTLAGGSGAETGNARVCGMVVDIEGRPIEGAVVTCVPETYNPVIDTPIVATFIDTTDDEGKYSFVITDETTFNIIIKKPGMDQRALVTKVNAESGTLTDATLKKTGSIKVIFPSSTVMQTGEIFLSGTQIHIKIRQSDITAGSILIDSVADGCYHRIIFSDSSTRFQTVLTEGICIKSGETLDIPVCLCSESAYGYDNHLLKPVKTQYSLSNGTITRNVWTGSKVALLTKDSTLDPCVIRRIVSVLDSAFTFNKKYIGQYPTLSKHYQGLITAAEVPGMNGVFNGFVGVSGIEMGEEQFQKLYQSVAKENTFPQELFFVVSNNFNFFMSRLTYNSNAKYSTAALRGFSVFMRFVTMQGIGVKAGTFMNLSLTQYKEKITTLMDTYIADTSLSFNKAFAVDTLPFSDLKSEHLFASMLIKLGNLYGDTLLQNLWSKIEERPVADNFQSAVDNLVLAASRAAGQDLTSLFTKWRFPVSDNAKSEAAKLFK
jgi:hypothetical protein